MTEDTTRPPDAWTPEQLNQALLDYPVMVALVMSDKLAVITLQNETHQLTLRLGPDWVRGEEVPLQWLPELRSH